MKWKTWKEFKQAVEAEGITDDTEISWIDLDCYQEVKILWPKVNPITKKITDASVEITGK